MWGKITPIYSAILPPKLWVCDFFIRPSFYFLSFWISLVQHLRFPWQNLYGLWNPSLLCQILLNLGSVKYHRRRKRTHHNIFKCTSVVSPATAENRLLWLGKQWKRIFPPLIWEKSLMSFYILCFTLAAILCTLCYLEWASWFSSTLIIKPHWNCNYTELPLSHSQVELHSGCTHPVWDRKGNNLCFYILGKLFNRLDACCVVPYRIIFCCSAVGVFCPLLGIFRLSTLWFVK